MLAPLPAFRFYWELMWSRSRFVILVVASLGAMGCSSLQEIEGAQLGATFPSAPGRKYFLKKSPFGTSILVCDGGPREAVCFEKPN